MNTIVSFLINVHGSATTFKLLTDEVNNIDCIVTLAPVKGVDILY